jgi:7-cyano-7-deazaguanine synthase in queuosine biosynthesis
MWSSGVDSTYCLARILKESKYERVHAHHIALHNFERRGNAESEALRKLMPKLQQIRPFTFTENLIDDSRMPTMVYDMARVCFEAGAVSKGFYHHPNQIVFDKWTIGTHEAEGHNWERWEVIKHATRAAEWTKGREKFIEFELQPMVSKSAEMEYLSDLGLLQDCWYCRTPQNGARCNRCKTCVEVDAAIMASGKLGTITRSIAHETNNDTSSRFANG